MIDVVILTQKDDLHARLVCEALIKKGASVRLLYTADLPVSMTGSILLGDGPKVALNGRHVECSIPSYEEIGVLWYRRIPMPEPSTLLSEGDRRFVTTEAQTFLRSALYILGKKSRNKVNDPSRAAIANLKPIQLIEAKTCGFTVPRTLISNDPSEIASFVSLGDTRKIHKSFTPYMWTNPDSGKTSSNYTQFISPEDAQDSESMQATPAIFQDYIEGLEELKVFVFGNEIEAVSVISRSTCDSRTDKYRQYVLPSIPLTQTERGMIHKLLDTLGLVVATLDFIRTKDGELVFLEVNESGNWLFMEFGVPELMLLDRFTNFLIDASGKSVGSNVTVRAQEIYDDA